MTTSEAVRVYDQFRIALQSLDPEQEMTARNALIQAHALTWHEGIHIASAIAAFRIIFRKLDDWALQNPSN